MKTEETPFSFTVNSEGLPGHWPRFEKIICSSMTEQERLGLPEHWIPSRWLEDLPNYINAVRSLEVPALLKKVEDSNTALPERIAAGMMLGLLGDPRINTLNPTMVKIQARTVQIGLELEQVDDVLKNYSDLGLDRPWIAKECPRHSVQLKSYSIAKYPVTNQEYRDFLHDSQLDLIPDSWAFRRYPQERSNQPVYTVTAEMADAYCHWLSKKTGKLYRLPSEAEWEYAAAGPDGYEFPWGNEFIPDYANTAEVGLFSSTPIGVFVEGNSPFGIADMAGNVEEFVADAYAAYPGSIRIEDHLTTFNPQYRVARGGTFARFRDLARTRRRHGHNPLSTVYAMGFRLAMTTED
jgi:toxoflavin biosynthesis protein ToxD